MTNKKIIEQLKALAIARPQTVISKLGLGDVIQKSCGLGYVIDDLYLENKLKGFPFPIGSIPYGPIYRGFRDSTSDIIKLFNGRENIPFSEAFNAGLGQCLEKSIMAQLANQRSGTGFLINGVLEINSEVGASPHAFNVLLNNSRLYLVDIQNPLEVNSEGKIATPYIAPMIDLLPSGEIRVSPEWEQDRKYFID
jgi:hypothetical protein